MRLILSILFIFSCYINLFASVDGRNLDFDANVLKEFDIDSSFMNTSYFKSMKQSVGQKQIDDFSRVLRRGYKNIYAIKETIRTSNLPDSFLFIPMIESGFVNLAVSGVKATGVWQFMDVTAQVHGLKIDKYVDERRDIVKSTKAAGSYLKNLKSQFGKWYLAVMAYNCGEGRLRKAIRQAGTDDLAVLLDPSKKYLPEETRKFIIKIIRASLMSKEPSFVVSKDSSLLNQTSSSLVRVSVPGGTNLKQVGDSIGISVKKLKDDNTHLKFVFTPPNYKKYHIYIPENKREIFAKNFKPVESINRFYMYTVQKGDTLFGISKKSGVSHKAIKEYNELTSSFIAVNQKLVIPRSNINKFQNYIVQDGDTLEILSKKFNVDIKDIKDANSLASSDILQVGVKIVIP